MFNVCYVGVQLGFLHIFNDVTYDVNNNVRNLAYWISTTSSQGKQRVVSFGRYKVVGDNMLIHL